ncbi:MAG: DUF4922 domain-containing protein [Gammaproteobacteria bacterium]|nr:DUF4922 domain-containing protein [Gammaproteobacteria bacterium]
MFDIKQVFSSSTLYTQAFEESLINILSYKTANTFILACANFIQHPEMLNYNSSQLKEAFNYIEKDFLECQNNNQVPDGSPDDIQVMNKIIEIGFNNLEPIQSKEIEYKNSYFLINYNQLRSFRPERMSTVKNIQLDTNFNASGFHFDKPFLKKETFSAGEINGRHISLLYNKFPFVKYHALLVIDKENHNKQYLTKEYLDYVFSLQNHFHNNLPELVIAYNSLGAGASVNHLHFQVFLETQALPISSNMYKHNGGEMDYPASCLFFSDQNSCWSFIKKLHANNTPYNLLFKNNKIYCLPRNMNHCDHSYLNLSTCGWSEMAGVFNLPNKDSFTAINSDKLTEVMQLLSSRSILQ